MYSRYEIIHTVTTVGSKEVNLSVTVGNKFMDTVSTYCKREEDKFCRQWAPLVGVLYRPFFFKSMYIMPKAIVMKTAVSIHIAAIPRPYSS